MSGQSFGQPNGLATPASKNENIYLYYGRQLRNSYAKTPIDLEFLINGRLCNSLNGT